MTAPADAGTCGRDRLLRQQPDHLQHSGGTYTTREYANISGAAGDDNVKSGGASDSLSVTNSETFNLSTESTPYVPFAGITAITEGGIGKDEGGGGAGGTVTVTNNQQLSVTGTQRRHRIGRRSPALAF
jgi:hypothetical protein